MYYAKFMPFDTMNGDGVRCTLFVSGCTLNCPHCHNKEAQNFRYGQEYTDETENMILNALDNEYVSGLTLTGGDPLEPKNFPNVLNLLKKIRSKYNSGKDIWLWSGRTLEEIKNTPQSEVLNYIDVLVDGRYIHDLRDESLQYRGSSNQRILYKDIDF